MTLGRRDLLKLAAAAGLAAKVADAAEPHEKRPGAMPALFVSHGSPMAAVESDDYTLALHTFGRAFAKPKAIVVMSAHWQTRGGILVTGSARPNTIHDFGGFPDELYRLTYASPGDPKLATNVAERLSNAGFNVDVDAQRGLDHGTWVPLRHTHPKADVPVIQVSLPFPRTPADMLRVGVALAPLRDEGVLLIGSGGAVHNLGEFEFDKHAPVMPWAKAFDSWLSERLAAFDVDGLQQWTKLAPNPQRAHPTSEHFDPIFFALGAAREGDKIHTLFEGIENGSMSLRTFALGS